MVVVQCWLWHGRSAAKQYAAGRMRNVRQIMHHIMSPFSHVLHCIAAGLNDTTVLFGCGNEIELASLIIPQ